MFYQICHTVFFCTVFAVMFSCGNEDPADSAEITPEMKENMLIIRQKVTDYTNAVNSQDIEAIVEQWSELAVYKNPETGQFTNGKEGIRNEFKKFFDKYKGAQVSVDVKTIRFPIEEKAVEEGVATLTMPGQEPVKSDYKMIYINENGDWKILHVSQLGFGLEE